MLKKGDLVKVTGTTITTAWERVELIPIGTICEVIDVDEKGVAELIPYKSRNSCGYWYSEEDVEKGKLEWIPESEAD